MSLRVRLAVKGVFILLGAVLLHACSGGGGTEPVAGLDAGDVEHTMAKGGGGGGGGGVGGGGVQIPPPPTIDGPAWFVYNFSAAVPTLPLGDINFDALKNTVQGGISIGASRTATEIVYNTSKKTTLTLTQIVFTGTNPTDFTIPAATVKSVLNTPLPANKGFAAVLPVTFSPTASGARSGTLRLVSNAGTVLVALSGTGLPNRPIIDTAGSLAFIAGEAPTNFIVTNDGGQGLILNSIAFGGANPGSFQLTVANSGAGNCFAGVELGPHSYCHLAVGVTAGAPVPSNAFLEISSNDPVQPKLDIKLSLAP